MTVCCRPPTCIASINLAHRSKGTVHTYITIHTTAYTPPHREAQAASAYTTPSSQACHACYTKQPSVPRVLRQIGLHRASGSIGSIGSGDERTWGVMKRFAPTTERRVPALAVAPSTMVYTGSFDPLMKSIPAMHDAGMQGSTWHARDEATM